MSLKQWIVSEKKRIEAERETVFKEKDYKDFWIAPVGESTITLMPKIPRPGTKFPGRAIFRIKVGNALYDWSINVRSPMYRDFVNHLALEPVELILVRTGTGKADTRYTVKSWVEK